MRMVEWKKIGDVCDVFAGGDLPSTYIKGNMPSEECIFPIYSNGVEEKSLYGFSDSYRVDKASITISARGTIGYHCIRKPYFTPIVRLITLIPKNIKNLNLSYLNEVLFNSNIDGTKGGIPQLTVPTVSRLLIPIPSIHEQERIVGILKTFTSSIDNLKQQITQRRKQHEHYRDQFLDVEGKDEKDIHTWGEFSEMIKGNGVQKVDFVKDGVGCIHYGQIYTHYGSFTYSTNKFVTKEVFEKARKASKGDIIMTDTSENVEDICKSVAYLGEDDIAVSNHALIIKHKQNPKFLSFSTQTNSFFLQKRKVVVGVKVSGIKPEHLAQIKIYLPSIEKQNIIVDILDKFEASIQNLEAQLSQREKQYEYYRNKLLTFE